MSQKLAGVVENTDFGSTLNLQLNKSNTSSNVNRNCLENVLNKFSKEQCDNSTIETQSKQNNCSQDLYKFGKNNKVSSPSYCDLFVENQSSNEFEQSLSSSKAASNRSLSLTNNNALESFAASLDSPFSQNTLSNKKALKNQSKLGTPSNFNDKKKSYADSFLDNAVTCSFSNNSVTSKNGKKKKKEMPQQQQDNLLNFFCEMYSDKNKNTSSDNQGTSLSFNDFDNNSLCFFSATNEVPISDDQSSVSCSTVRNEFFSLPENLISTRNKILERLVVNSSPIDKNNRFTTAGSSKQPSDKDRNAGSSMFNFFIQKPSSQSTCSSEFFNNNSSNQPDTVNKCNNLIYQLQANQNSSTASVKSGNNIFDRNPNNDATNSRLTSNTDDGRYLNSVCGSIKINGPTCVNSGACRDNVQKPNLFSTIDRSTPRSTQHNNDAAYTPKASAYEIHSTKSDTTANKPFISFANALDKTTQPASAKSPDDADKSVSCQAQVEKDTQMWNDLLKAISHLGDSSTPKIPIDSDDFNKPISDSVTEANTDDKPRTNSNSDTQGTPEVQPNVFITNTEGISSTCKAKQTDCNKPGTSENNQSATKSTDEKTETNESTNNVHIHSVSPSSLICRKKLIHIESRSYSSMRPFISGIARDIKENKWHCAWVKLSTSFNGCYDTSKGNRNQPLTDDDLFPKNDGPAKHKMLLAARFINFQDFVNLGTVNFYAMLRNISIAETREDPKVRHFEKVCAVRQLICDIQSLILAALAIKIDFYPFEQLLVRRLTSLFLSSLYFHPLFIEAAAVLFLNIREADPRDCFLLYLIRSSYLSDVLQYVFELFMIRLFHEGNTEALLLIISSFKDLDYMFSDLVNDRDFSGCLGSKYEVLGVNSVVITNLKFPRLVVVALILKLCYEGSYDLLKQCGLDTKPLKRRFVTSRTEANNYILTLLVILLSVPLASKITIHRPIHYRILYTNRTSRSFDPADLHKYFSNFVHVESDWKDEFLPQTSLSGNDICDIICAFLFMQCKETLIPYLDILDKYNARVTEQLANAKLAASKEEVQDRSSNDNATSDNAENNADDEQKTDDNASRKIMNANELWNNEPIDMGSATFWHPVANPFYHYTNVCEKIQQVDVRLIMVVITQHEMAELKELYQQLCDETTYFCQLATLRLFTKAHVYDEISLPCFQLYELIARLTENNLIQNRKPFINSLVLRPSESQVQIIKRTINELTGCCLGRFDILFLRLLTQFDICYGISYVFSGLAERDVSFNKALIISKISLTFLMIPFLHNSEDGSYHLPQLNPKKQTRIGEHFIFPTLLPEPLARSYPTYVAHRLIQSRARSSHIVGWRILLFELCCAAAAVRDVPDSFPRVSCIHMDDPLILLFLLFNVRDFSPRAIQLLVAFDRFCDYDSNYNMYDYCLLLLKIAARPKFVVLADTLSRVRFADEKKSNALHRACLELAITCEDVVRAEQLLKQQRSPCPDMEKAVDALRNQAKSVCVKDNQVKKALLDVHRCTIQKNFESAVKLFNEMRNSPNGLFDVSVVNKILHFCVNENEIEQAAKIFLQVLNDSQLELNSLSSIPGICIKADVVTCNIMIKGLSQMPETTTQDAIDFIKFMERPCYQGGIDMKPDQVTFYSAVTLAVNNKDLAGLNKILRMMADPAVLIDSLILSLICNLLKSIALDLRDKYKLNPLSVSSNNNKKCLIADFLNASISQHNSSSVPKQPPVSKTGWTVREFFDQTFFERSESVSSNDSTKQNANVSSDVSPDSYDKNNYDSQNTAKTHQQYVSTQSSKNRTYASAEKSTKTKSITTCNTDELCDDCTAIEPVKKDIDPVSQILDELLSLVKMLLDLDIKFDYNLLICLLNIQSYVSLMPLIHKVLLRAKEKVEQSNDSAVAYVSVLILGFAIIDRYEDAASLVSIIKCSKLSLETIKMLIEVAYLVADPFILFSPVRQSLPHKLSKHSLNHFMFACLHYIEQRKGPVEDVIAILRSITQSFPLAWIANNSELLLTFFRVLTPYDVAFIDMLVERFLQLVVINEEIFTIYLYCLTRMKNMKLFVIRIKQIIDIDDGNMFTTRHYNNILLTLTLMDQLHFSLLDQCMVYTLKKMFKKNKKPDNETLLLYLNVYVNYPSRVHNYIMKLLRAGDFVLDEAVLARIVKYFLANKMFDVVGNYCRYASHHYGSDHPIVDYVFGMTVRRFLL